MKTRTDTNNLPTTATTSTFLDRLAAAAPSNSLPILGSMQFGDEVKYVTVNVPAKKYPNGIEIMHLTDVQFGSKACNVPKYIEYRDWILSEPNRFVVFGGDMIDAATVLSIASPFDNDGDPQGQVYRFVELTMPMRGRVLGYVGGNHERRTVKTFGDAGHLIASLLKIPYSSGLQFIDIRYGKHDPFKFMLYHGKGAAQTSGAKLMMAERVAKDYPGSDMYLVGHLHDCFCKYYTAADRADGKISLRKYAVAMSSSFLDFFGSYAEVAGLSANDLHMWLTRLTPNGKWELRIR